MRPELTKRADYAIRAMLTLVRSGEDGPLSARRISERMDIPGRFLPQVMSDLSRAGLVRAEPGRLGGYRLARPADQVSLLDVIEAVEGDSRRRSCVLRGSPCGGSGYCDVHHVFIAAQDRMLATFAGASLASLVESAPARRAMVPSGRVDPLADARPIPGGPLVSHREPARPGSGG